MIWLLANWRLFAAMGLFAAGWYTHTVWDGYRSQNAEIKAVDSLGKGEAAIEEVHQKIHKEISNDKDCANKPHSPALGKLLY